MPWPRETRGHGIVVSGTGGDARMVAMTSPWHRGTAGIAIAVALALGGCGPAASSRVTAEPGATAAAGMSGAAPAAPSAADADVPAPAPPTFATPREAVESYLAWVSYANEVADSDVATMTFSAGEEARVNAYVQLNIERGRRIRQRLVRFAAGAPETAGARRLVLTRETWAYRYLDLTSSKALSPTYTAEYVATYTVMARPRGGWLVDSVKVEALGPVK